MSRTTTALIGVAAIALAILEIDGRFAYLPFAFQPLLNAWHWILGISAIVVATTNKSAAHLYSRGICLVLLASAIAALVWHNPHYAIFYGALFILALVGGFAHHEGRSHRTL